MKHLMLEKSNSRKIERLSDVQNVERARFHEWKDGVHEDAVRHLHSIAGDEHVVNTDSGKHIHNR